MVQSGSQEPAAEPSCAPSRSTGGFIGRTHGALVPLRSMCRHIVLQIVHRVNAEAATASALAVLWTFLRGGWRHPRQNKVQLVDSEAKGTHGQQALQNTWRERRFPCRRSEAENKPTGFVFYFYKRNSAALMRIFLLLNAMQSYFIVKYF